MRLIKHVWFVLAMMAGYIYLIDKAEGLGWHVVIVAACVHLGAVTNNTWPIPEIDDYDG